MPNPQSRRRSFESTSIGQRYAAAKVPRRHTANALAIKDKDSPKEWLTVRDKVIRRMGSGCILALLGPRGPGKTQIAQLAVAHACAAGETAFYIRAMSIFLELRATIGSEEPGDTELAVVAWLREPFLLVIDECQVRGETRFENTKLDHLLDLRYGDMSDTVLIANWTPAALEESMGTSIMQRLRETGGIIECKWSSFRTSAKGKANVTK